MDPRLFDSGGWGLSPLLPVDDEAEAEAKRRLGILESPSLKSAPVSAPSVSGFGLSPLFDEPARQAAPPANLNLPLTALDRFGLEDLASKRYDLVGAIPGLGSRQAPPPELPPWQETSDPRAALAQRDARLRAMGALPASEVQDAPPEYGLYETLKQLPGATLEKMRQGLAEGAANTATAIRRLDVRAPEGMASVDPLPLIADALDTYANQPESPVKRPAIESEGVYGQLARPVTDVASTLGKFLPATMVAGAAGPVGQLAAESFGGNLERQKASGYEDEYGKLDSTVLAATKAAADAATMQIAAVPAIKKFVMGDREVLPTLARIVRSAWKDAGLAGSQVLAMTTAQAALDHMAGNFDPNAMGPDTAQMLREGKPGEAWRTFATDPAVIGPVKEALTWAMFSGLHSGYRGLADNLAYTIKNQTTPGAVERQKRGWEQADADREAARQAAIAVQEPPAEPPAAGPGPTPEPPKGPDLTGIDLTRESPDRLAELWYQADAAGDNAAKAATMREIRMRQDYPNWQQRPDAATLNVEIPRKDLKIEPVEAAPVPPAAPEAPPEAPPEAAPAAPAEAAPAENVRPIESRKRKTGWSPSSNVDIPDAGLTSDGREMHVFGPRGLDQGSSWIEGPVPRKMKANAYDREMADTIVSAAQEEFDAADRTTVTPTGWVKGKGGKSPDVIVTDSGARIDGRVYDYVQERHPGARLESPKENPSRIYLVSSDGKLIGEIGTVRRSQEPKSAAAPEPLPSAPPVAVKAPEPPAEVPPAEPAKVVEPERPAQERYDEAKERYLEAEIGYQEVTAALRDPELPKERRRKYETIQSANVSELSKMAKQAKQAAAEGATIDPELDAKINRERGGMTPEDEARKWLRENRPPPRERPANPEPEVLVESDDPRVIKLDKEIKTKTEQIDRANANGNIKLGAKLQAARSDLIVQRRKLVAEAPAAEPVTALEKTSEGIELVANTQVTKRVQKAVFVAANNKMLGALARRFGVRRIVIDPAYTFGLSQQGGVAADGTIRLHPDVQDFGQTLGHEIGHLAWENMTPEQRKIARKLTDRRADLGYPDDPMEQWSELISRHDPEAHKLAMSVREGMPERFAKIKPESVERPPAPERRSSPVSEARIKSIREAINRDGNAYLDQHDNLERIAEAFPDAVVVVKDTNGGRHVMSIDSATRLLKEESFSNYVREAWMRKRQDGDPKTLKADPYTTQYLPIMAKAMTAEANRLRRPSVEAPKENLSVGREPSARGPKREGESAATLRSRRDFWLKREAEASLAGKAGDANSQAELAYARRQRESYERQLDAAEAAEARIRAGQSEDTRTGTLFDVEPVKPEPKPKAEVPPSPTEQTALFSAGREANKRGPKPEEAKPEEPKAEAELPDEPGGPGYEEPTKAGHWAITELPEVVELTEKLNKGKVPKLMNRLGRAANRIIQGRLGFKEGDPNSAIVMAARGLLQKAKDGTVNAQELAKVLLHEIGHLVDFLPEGTFERGNVLGHVAGLARFMKHTIRNVAIAGESDPSLKPLELRKRAEKETPREPKEQYWAWKRRARKRYNELRDELLKTDYSHKKLVADELMRVSLRHFPAPEGADARYMAYRRLPKELYADAVSAMLYDPHLFETLAPHTMALIENYTKANKPEAWQAFEDMRKLQAAGPDVLTEHRSQRAMQATREGLLARIKEMWKGRPELDAEGKRLAGRRVMFGREFIDTVAPYYAYSREVMRNVKRRGELEKASRKGTLKAEEQTELGELRKKGGRLDLVKQAIRDLDAARHANTEKAAFMLEVHEAVIKPAEEAGLNINHLGNFAKLRDAAQSPEIAGELGIMGKHAQEVYDHDYRRLTKRQQEALDTALGNWRQLREARVLSVLEASQALSEAAMKKLWSNTYYARRQLVEEMEKHDPTSALKLREGDFGRLGNSFMETMLTDMGLMQWAHRQEAARHTVDFLKTDFEKYLKDAPVKKVGNRKIPQQPSDESMALLSYRHLGEEIHKWVPKYLAELHHRNPRELSRLYRTYSKAMAPFRALMVTHNPGFALWNFRRDRIETIKKAMVNENPISAWAKSYYYSWQAAKELGREVGLGNLLSEGMDPDKSLYTSSELAMLRGRGMTLPGKHSYARADEINPENLPDALLVRLGFSEKLFDQHISEPARRAKAYADTLSDVLSMSSRYSERVGKIAGYKYLKARQDYLRPRMAKLEAKQAADPNFKLSRRERREQSEWEQINTEEKLMARVRNRVGTPDVLRHGVDEIHALTNSIFLFSNVSKEGMRGHIESYRENPVSYTMKTVMYTILPKMIQIAAAKGAIGYFMGETPEQEKDRKNWWASVDRADIANYLVVPNPVAPWRLMADGKTREARYMRFPYDFTGVSIAKLIEAANVANVEGFRTQDLARIADETLPWALSSLNPALESLLWWGEYTTGKNPVSLFSGAPIYSDREWDAGAGPTKLFWETWSNLGGSLIYNPGQFDRAMTETDFESWLRAAGPLGALMNRVQKTSNRGIQQGESAAWARAQKKQLRDEGERREFQTNVLKRSQNANMRDAYLAAKAKGIYVGPVGKNEWNSWEGAWRRVDRELYGDRLEFARERAKQNQYSIEEFRRLGERTGIDYLPQR